MKVSAVILITNEDTYKATFDSIKGFVDEILVADNGMSAELKAQVKKYPKVRIVNMGKKVPYIELIRQKLIDKAKHDWILHLDPDEVCTPEMLSYLADYADGADYFIIPRKNIIMGHWMRHSRWWPDPQVRFFKKHAAKWSTTIHSQPDLSGFGHELPEREKLALEHYNYVSYDQYIEKSTRYARGEAQKYIENKTPFTISRALQLGLSEFMSRFFMHQGYKDGIHGFVLAFSQLLYYFQVYVYYWEAKGYTSTGENSVKHVPLQFFEDALYEVHHWNRVEGMIKKPLQRIRSRIISQLLE